MYERPNYFVDAKIRKLKIEKYLQEGTRKGRSGSTIVLPSSHHP
jgi:hypothetical protein